MFVIKSYTFISYAMLPKGLESRRHGQALRKSATFFSFKDMFWQVLLPSSVTCTRQSTSTGLNLK